MKTSFTHISKKGLEKIDDLNKFNLKSLFAKYEDELLKELHNQINTTLNSSELKSYEKPKRVYISLKEMTVDNECITPSMKIRRNNAKK